MPLYQASQGIFDGEKTRNASACVRVDAQGYVVELLDQPPIGERAEKLDGLLSPGLINGHCHVELSHLQGRIDRGTGLVGFIEQIFALRQQPLPLVEAAARKALTQLWDNGVQAVGDVCNTTQALAAKLHSPLRFVNFVEVSGFVPATAEPRLQQGLAVLAAHETALPGTNQLVPHAPYSVSAKLFAGIARHNRAGLPTTMHNQEAAAENELFAKGSGPFLDLYASLGIDLGFFQPSGRSSLDTVWPWLPASPLLLVHNTHYQLEAVLTSHPAPVHFCLCPRANLYIENSLPPLEALMQSGAGLLLGTDSLASNDRLCVWAEAQTLLQHCPGLALEKVLAWATSGGADALGLGDTLGRLLPGRAPGLVLLKNDRAQRLH